MDVFKICILGTPPTIDRNDSTASNTVTIGRNICLEIVPASMATNLVCAQIGDITPIPSSTFTFNGEPIVPRQIFDVQGDTMNIIPGILTQFMLQGEVKCVLMNRFGNDTETSQLLLSK